MQPYLFTRFLLRHFVIAALYFAALICGISCSQQASRITGTPAGYDLAHPLKMKLPTVLNEISGLYYYPKDSSLFAIEDEEGYLYKIFPNHPKNILRWKFAGHGDFEDLTLVDNTFYMLRSDGSIFRVNIAGKDSITTVKFKYPGDNDEYETLYYEDRLKMLVMICKNCEDDKKKSLGTYGFDPVKDSFSANPFKIDARDVARMIGEKSIHLKASAAAIHPLTGQLWILCSVNKLLVIANRDGTIIDVYPLSPQKYKQPEGIAFAPDGTLYISNESHNDGAANILTIPYKPNGK